MGHHRVALAATILVGALLSQECARDAELLRSEWVHPAATITTVAGEPPTPPRLASHPAALSRVLSDQFATDRQGPAQRRQSGAGAATLGRGILRPTWIQVAGAALLVASLILRWRPARNPEPRITSQLNPRPATNVLEALIGNRLPIIEEPLPLPYGSQVFGRPLHEPQYRVDEHHSLHGPHFETETLRQDVSVHDPQGGQAHFSRQMHVPLPKCTTTANDGVREKCPSPRPVNAYRQDEPVVSSHSAVPHVEFRHSGLKSRIDAVDRPAGPGVLDRAFTALGERP